MCVVDDGAAVGDIELGGQVAMLMGQLRRWHLCADEASHAGRRCPLAGVAREPKAGPVQIANSTTGFPLKPLQFG